MEKFNKPYKRFAEAAKQAGFSASERKDFARDPEKLLEYSGGVIERKTSPEKVRSLFAFLQERDRTIPPKDILAFGNVLYKFRPDRKGQGLAMNDSEAKVLTLAGVLIEDAFYDGALVDLPKEHGAAMTFALNQMGKIFERSENGMKLGAFDPERAQQFIKRVGDYESRTVRDAYEDSQQLSTSEQSTMLSRLQEVNQAFNEARTSIEGNIERQGKSAIPYLMKTCLIANDMAAGYKKENERNRRERIMSTGFLMSEDLTGRSDGRTGYTFFREDVNRNNRGYAKQHFISGEIPFSVWASRYLRSLRENVVLRRL